MSRWGWVDSLVPCASTIDSHRLISVTDTIFVDICIVVCRDVPVASLKVIDVVTQLCSAFSDTSTNAEFTVRDEACPVMVLETLAKPISVYKSSDRVAPSISTSVVQFTTRVTLGDIDLGEVANTGYLNVFGGLNEVNTLKSTVREGSSTTTVFGAVSNLDTFGITDSSMVWRAPKTKVFRRIDPESLTIRPRIRTGSTVVCTVLIALRGLREVINGVACIPDLVDTAIAVPNLGGSAICLVSTSKINALVIRPNHTVIACIRKLLARIVRITCPYLKFIAVYVAATCYVQAFVSKGLYSPSCEDPILSGGFAAGLYSDSRSIGVRRGCQAFGTVETWLQEKFTYERRCLRPNREG